MEHDSALLKALVRALKKDNVKAINALLGSLKTPLDELRVKERPLLHYCIAHKFKIRAILQLIDAGASLETIDAHGATPLHLSVMHGNGPLSHMLIILGAKVDVRDHHNRTPLHVAAFYGDAFSVHLLLSVGASMEATAEQGETPLFLTAEQGLL